jgi:hypothetical protein
VENKAGAEDDSMKPVVRPSLKPNGQPTGTFLLSIDDGYVEYVYVLPLRWKAANIDRVYQRIRKALRLREQTGKIRTRHWDKANAPAEAHCQASPRAGCSEGR